MKGGDTSGKASSGSRTAAIRPITNSDTKNMIVATGRRMLNSATLMPGPRPHRSHRARRGSLHRRALRGPGTGRYHGGRAGSTPPRSHTGTAVATHDPTKVVTDKRGSERVD